MLNHMNPMNNHDDGFWGHLNEDTLCCVDTRVLVNRLIIILNRQPFAHAKILKTIYNLQKRQIKGRNLIFIFKKWHISCPKKIISIQMAVIIQFVYCTVKQEQ